MLGREEVELAETDAMLAGRSASHRQRTRYQPLVDRVCLVEIVLVLRIDKYHEVKIAVADVTEQRNRHRSVRDVFNSCGDAFGKPRYRHADVGCNTAASGTQR